MWGLDAPIVRAMTVARWSRGCDNPRVGRGFLRSLEQGLPSSLRASTDLRRRALFTQSLALLILAAGFVFAFLVYFLVDTEYRLLGTVNCLLFCGSAGFGLAIVRRGYLHLAGNWIVALLTLGIGYAVVAGGGVRAPFAVALPIIPVISIVISGQRSGIIWALIIAAFLGIVESMRVSGFVFPDHGMGQGLETLTLTALLASLGLLAWISSFSEDLKLRAIRVVEEAAEQRDRAVAEQAKAETAAEQAIAANVAKSAFLATMSHELRTPLNAIIGYSELVEEELGEALGEHVESMRRIRNAGQHLVHLISDILDLARLEADRLEIRPEPFEFKALLEDLAVTFQPLAHKRGNSIIARCDLDVGTLFHDRVRLRQIMINLLGNAIKFTEDGMITLSAKRTRIDGRIWIEITVTDTGVGIPPEKLGMIFDSFVQVDSSFNRSYEGSGLGLAIVRKLCIMMGGAVRVTSTVGSGTTLTLRIPADIREDMPVDYAPR